MEYEKVLECCDILLSKNKADSWALNSAGLALNELNRHKEAIEFFDKVLSVDEKNITALMNKANSLSFLQENQKAKFWDTIFEICRIKNEDPIAIWEDHIKQLAARCKYLNQKQFVLLKYDAPGTDLTIGLPKGHIWGSARFKTQSGIDFVGNIPTEEVFTTTDKDKTEGIVKATKPIDAATKRT